MARKTYKKKAVKKKTVAASRYSHGQWLSLGHSSLKARLSKVIVLLLFPVFIYGIYLNALIDQRFVQERWQIGASVFGRSLELMPGKAYSRKNVLRELKLLGYQAVVRMPSVAGSYYAGRDGSLHVYRRSFDYGGEHLGEQRFSLYFSGDQVTDIRANFASKRLDFVRLDPVYLGQFDSLQKEERLYVSLSETPLFLQNALLAVEDKDFYQHIGLSFGAILRAAFRNMKSGGLVQGGSTITQQLVKNFFLTREKTLSRKMKEAYIAVLLEFKFSKQEILEAYINEVYLGQDGNRAIHGFGMASQFFFSKPLSELSQGEVAVLVGMLKAPTVFNPVRYKNNALKRRNQVVHVLHESGLLDAEEKAKVLREPLLVARGSGQRYRKKPALFDWVRRELLDDYSKKALSEKGLKIYTTIDPVIQAAVENNLTARIQRFSSSYQSPDHLQGAVIVTSAKTGEVLGFAGGKNKNEDGFNRGLDAYRPIGSLIKPVVFMTALGMPQKYSLMSELKDQAFTVRLENGAKWQPQNFDKKEHGPVKLYEALMQSYNLSTARLGLELGLANIVQTLQGFGIKRVVRPYPSLTLGALELSPYQVAQIYNTLANGGMVTKPTIIHAVVNKHNTVLSRYPIIARPAFDPAVIKLISFGLQQVIQRGTGKALSWKNKQQGIAGKTGTSDKLRDSWFAGYSGEHMGVVWLGNDANKPVDLSGATGALRVWDDIMADVSTTPLEVTEEDDIQFVWVDKETGLHVDKRCGNAVRIPFIRDFLPTQSKVCPAKLARSEP